MTNRIDILEEEILRLDEVVMERLLWDPQEQIPVLDEHGLPVLDSKGKPLKKHHHIYWATDNYESRGEGFHFFDEIEIVSVTGKNRQFVRPRAAKSKAEQEDKREKIDIEAVNSTLQQLVKEGQILRQQVDEIVKEL